MAKTDQCLAVNVFLEVNQPTWLLCLRCPRFKSNSRIPSSMLANKLNPFFQLLELPRVLHHIWSHLVYSRSCVWTSPSATLLWVTTSWFSTSTCPLTSSSHFSRSTGRTSGPSTSNPPWDQPSDCTKQTIRLWSHFVTRDNIWTVETYMH